MARLRRDDLDRFFDYGVDPNSRTIYVGSVYEDSESGESGVDSQLADKVVKAIYLLDSQAPNGDKPITIILNNPGGDWYHGMAIYDAINSCQNHITIKVFGMAMSMGAVILQAADERVIAPNAKIMIHYGEAGTYSHSKIVKKWAAEFDKIDKKMMEIFLEQIRKKHPDFKDRKLDKMLDFDTILSAEEAVNLGLADRIL